MKKQEIQTNFTAGELSPRLYAHVDSNKYRDGLKTATNLNILPHGPLARRNGSQYINSTKSSNNTVRLIRFQFSQTNTYILEFGNNYIRFYKNGAIVMSGMSPYEISTSWADTDLYNLTYVQFGTTLYIAHFNTAPQQLVWTSDTSWALSAIPFSPPATDESGYAPSGTVTPGATSGLGITFTTSIATFLDADVGRQKVNKSGTGKASITSVTDSTHAVCSIVESFPSTSAISSPNWILDLSPLAEIEADGTKIDSTVIINAIDPTENGKFTPNVSLTPGATTGSGINFTTSSPAFTADHVGYRVVSLVGQGDGVITSITSSTVAVVTITKDWFTTGAIAATDWEMRLPIGTFRSADVGRYIRIQNGIGIINSVNSPSQISATLLKSMNQASGTQNWSIETPSWSSSLGYPRVVAMHQQRLVFESTASKPQSVWMSGSGIFTSLGVGSLDNDAIELDIVTSQANQINWSLGLRGDLVLGTFSGENSISATGGGVITPSSASQLSRSFNGGNLQQAIVIGHEGLYVQKSNRKIMAISYSFMVDTYESEDLTFLAEHITLGGIKEIVYGQDPDRRIYALLNNGNIAVGTYYKEQQVMGWSTYTTDGSYESIQTISTGQYTEVWIAVKRTVNGSTVRYIERFDTGDGSSPIDGFSDCYLYYYLPKTITGITQASPGIVTSNSHGFSNGDKVKIRNTTGMSEVNNKTYYVASSSTNTFALTDSTGANINTSGFSAYVSGGTVHKLVTTISGLSHLEGKTVQVKQDGALAADKIVSSGTITLDTPGYAVTVGLKYNMIAHTLSKEYNIGIGSQQGQQGRLVRPILRLVSSEYPILNGEYKPARSPTDHMDYALSLFTGDVVYGGFTWTANIEFDIQTDKPFPCIVCGIFGSIDGGSQ